MPHSILHSPIFPKSDPPMRDRTPLLSNLDPRESMKRNLPDWMQPFLAQLIAKPYVGEQPHQKSVGFDVLQKLAM